MPVLYNFIKIPAKYTVFQVAPKRPMRYAQKSFVSGQKR